MDIEQKKREILKALETGEVSQRDIDSTKGRNAKRLREGVALEEKAVNRMYETLVDIRKKSGEKAQQQKKTGTAIKPQIAPKPQNNIAKLIEENCRLKAVIDGLEKEVASLKQAQNLKEEKQACYTVEDVVNGFYLREEKTTSVRYNKDGSKHVIDYVKYYAKKRLSGKLHRIYIGEDLNKATVDAKIEVYLKKHGIVIAETV